MDASKVESPRPAAILKGSPVTGEIARVPLALSEKNNASKGVRKPKTREIASRYKSGITPSNSSLSMLAASSRCPSPTATRTSTVSGPSTPKRSQSSERRRPATPLKYSAPSAPQRSPSRPSTPSSPSRLVTPVRDSTIDSNHSSRRLFGLRTADGLWPSMRSLSTSFQSESISIPTKREKSGNSSSGDPKSKSSTSLPTERRRTPLRGRNSSDQSENSKPVENGNSRAVDHHRWPGIMGAKLSAANMTRSMDLTSSILMTARGISPRRVAPISDGTDKIIQKSTGDATRRLSLDGIGRFDCQKGSGLSSSNNSERSLSLTRPSRTLSMPIPSASRPSSPSRASMNSISSSRVAASPCRTRPSSPLPSAVANGRSGIASSVLSYICDVRRGKKNSNHVEDAHQLRLLHNRYLQWRFINARAETALSIQKITTEDILYNIWATTMELHESVVEKKTNIERLKQEMKLDAILKEQMMHLEDWASLEREHSGSLSGAIEALKASTIRLPVTGGARADFNSLKDIISSAVDVMRTMGSSVCCLLSRVDGTNSLVSELSDIAAEERAMLVECKELLASTAAIQVQESSLRTHLVQLRQNMLNVG